MGHWHVVYNRHGHEVSSVWMPNPLTEPEEQYLKGGQGKGDPKGQGKGKGPGKAEGKGDPKGKGKGKKGKGKKGKGKKGKGKKGKKGKGTVKGGDDDEISEGEA